MTLRHLKIFVSVFQNGSVTKASKELHLAQPSVSLAVRELEEYYGICLFDRIGRTIAPTEGGREFYGYAVHVVGLFDEMEKKIRNWDAIGVLRVGSSITIGTHILPELLKQFQKRYPGLKVEAVVANSAIVEERLLHNEVDIGLVETTPEQQDILAEPFMDDMLCAVAAPGHPLTQKGEVRLTELAEYPFLMREKGSSVRDAVDACLALLQLQVRPAWESVSSQAIVRAAAAGLGVTILPYLLVREDLERGTVARIPLASPIRRKLNVIYHKSKYLTENMKIFMEMAREYGRGESSNPTFFSCR